MMNVARFTQPLREYTQARRHQRVPVDFAVQVRTEGLRLADRARDLCESGVGLETVDPLPPMTLVSLRLDVPHEGSIDVLGRVMWSEGRAMGVRFEGAEPRVYDALDRLRRELSAI